MVEKFWQGSVAQLMSEILQGVYDGLQENVELHKDESASLIIESGPGEESWVLTLRKIPEQEQSAEKELSAVS